jgi:serine/threonine-protein kinase
MHMPPRPPSAPPPSAQAAQAQQAHAGGGMHQSLSNYPSAPPQAQQPAVAVQMPPVSRAPSPMEATALVPRPQQSKAGLMVALFLAVCAIVGIGVFFVMGRTGTLVVNVADSQGGAVQSLQVLVDGSKKCDSAPCILHDVPSGIHEVKVVADGYEPPAAKGVTVGRVDATVDFALVPAKGGQGGTGFKVTGNQPGVKLFVDGKEVGALPQEVKDLEPGDHQLHFVGSDRYAPLDKSVTVGKDEMVDIGNVALKVLKGKVTIQLGTPGAKVYLVNGANRKEVPQFPIAIDFDPNEKWQLEAKKDGYEPLVQPIRFDDGIAEKTINVVLSPKGSKAAAAPPSFAAAAPFAASAPAAPKAPVAKAEPKGETPSASEKPAKAEKPEKAAGGEALLNINSLPASTVVLDGKPLGPTPRVKVPVSPGTHTVLFVNAEQSLKKSITVTVGPGEMKAAFAKLRD